MLFANLGLHRGIDFWMISGCWSTVTAQAGVLATPSAQTVTPVPSTFPRKRLARLRNENGLLMAIPPPGRKAREFAHAVAKKISAA